MKVKVNKEACIGCGACMSIADDVFEMDNDGLSSVKVAEVPEGSVDQAKEAVESCPTGAIEEA
ncbi:MAG: ferredoxin [Bacilli bacterium]|nr:ferredoxin [Bacilli bacterium]